MAGRILGERKDSKKGNVQRHLMMQRGQAR